MKTRVMITSVPGLVAGGMILFLGCGAESQKTGHAQSGSDVAATAAAITPATTNPSAVPIEPVPKIVTAPPRLSPGVDEIVQLAQAGVGDEVLQAYIENTPTPYKLNVDEILYLHDLGLSVETIAAMVRHNQSLQDQSTAPAVANAQPSPTITLAPPAEQPVAQPAATTQDSSINPAPVDSAYASTPPQQVSYNYFYQTLAPYGSWVEIPSYGWCWQPTVSVIDVGWRPYSNSGRWLWTDCGWYWQSDYSWGWVPFHYGRWYRSPLHGWVWAPDTTWGPAWVTWRYSDRYCGWAPLPPGAYFDVGLGFRFHGGRVGVGFDFGLVPDCYTFIPTAYFCDYRPWRYGLPRGQIVTVFNRTKIINNFGTTPNGRAIVNVGPGRNAIASVTRTEIRKVTLRDVNPTGNTVIKPDRLDRNSATLAVFRPKLPQQAQTPPPQIIRHQQELRKSAETLARKEGIKPAAAGATRGTPVAPSAAPASVVRGTPPTAPRPIEAATGNHTPGIESQRGNVASPSPQNAQPSRNTPAISRSPRSEQRSFGTAQSSPSIVRPSQTEPAPRPLAEISPRTIGPGVPDDGGRAPVYQPQPNAPAQIRSQPSRREPVFPVERPPSVYQPQARPQVITPPVYREEGRSIEPPAYTPPATVRPVAPAPYAISPRAPESRSSSPGYQPPRNFSPPPAAPRAIEAPAFHPSSPPRPYSPPPAPSRPQSAPSSSPSPSRSEGGRRP
ncbi:MAG: hypothetical protein DME23_07350 [Verrucomicrobia bacterium]|nr:MAG: hypothetical protein DME23_07350 [Verrucomicrobiota bacterium]